MARHVMHYTQYNARVKCLVLVETALSDLYILKCNFFMWLDALMQIIHKRRPHRGKEGCVKSGQMSTWRVLTLQWMPTSCTIIVVIVTIHS